MLKTETVTVKAPPLSGFRTVTKRRGKKFCFFVHWKLEPVQDLEIQHGLDVEDELVKNFYDSFREE